MRSKQCIQANISFSYSQLTLFKRIQFLFAVLFIFGLFMTGCTVFAPIKNQTIKTYELNTLPPVQQIAHNADTTLLVAVPDTNSTYNSVNMAYSHEPFAVAYYTRNRWVATPSAMLHPLIIAALQQSGLFQAIVTPPYSGRYDYVLTTEITKLQFNLLTNPATVQFNLRVQLFKMANNGIVATRNIHIQQTMIDKTPYAGVVAANQAVQQALQAMIQFCSKQLQLK